MGYIKRVDMKIKTIIFLIIFFPILVFSQDDIKILESDAVAALNEENFELAVELFNRILELDSENVLAQNTLPIAEKLLESSKVDGIEKIDEFIEEQNNPTPQEDNNQLATIENPNEQISGEDEDEELNFVDRQIQRNLAKEERDFFLFSFGFPFAVNKPSSVFNITRPRDDGGWMTGIDIYTDFHFDFSNRIFGGFIRYGGYYPNETVEPERVNSQLDIGISFRNFFAEEIDAKFVLGTRIGFGLLMQSSLDSQPVDTYPAWSLSIFLSDPIFYHIFNWKKAKPILLEGEVRFQFSENLTAIFYSGSLVWQMQRLRFGFTFSVWDTIYVDGPRAQVYLPALFIGARF